jgi:hypothetical protein
MLALDLGVRFLGVPACEVLGDPLLCRPLILNVILGEIEVLGDRASPEDGEKLEAS